MDGHPNAIGKRSVLGAHTWDNRVGPPTPGQALRSPNQKALRFSLPPSFFLSLNPWPIQLSPNP